MPPASKRGEGDVIHDVLAVADLLRQPQFAQPYVYLARALLVKRLSWRSSVKRLMRSLSVIVISNWLS